MTSHLIEAASNDDETKNLNNQSKKIQSSIKKASIINLYVLFISISLIVTY